jgi:hypothetical protein
LPSGVSLSGLKIIQVSICAHINAIFYVVQKKKKEPNGVKSELLVGRKIEPLQPIHLPGNVALKTSTICGCAPSWWWPLMKLFECRDVKAEHSVIWLLCTRRQSLPKPDHYFFGHGV